MKKEDKPYCTFSYKHYRRFKPLIRKDNNLIRINFSLLIFTIICGPIVYFSDELPEIFSNCSKVLLTLSVLTLFYTVYMKLKLIKQIKKVEEEIKEEQKSQFK